MTTSSAHQANEAWRSGPLPGFADVWLLRVIALMKSQGNIIIICQTRFSLVLSIACPYFTPSTMLPGQVSPLIAHHHTSNTDLITMILTFMWCRKAIAVPTWPYTLWGHKSQMKNIWSTCLYYSEYLYSQQIYYFHFVIKYATKPSKWSMTNCCNYMYNMITEGNWHTQMKYSSAAISIAPPPTLYLIRYLRLQKEVLGDS